VEILCKHISELDQVVSKLIAQAQQRTCWTFEAEMGNGKTTTINQICKQLGVIDHTSSPTYGIVNEYKTNNGKSIFHFDCYRLKNLQEALDIGIEDYIDSSNICLIEWPQIITDILPFNTYQIKIIISENEERVFITN
jgi:tRNA threonylcarbamoyladenosine biosynthesis protein TsaE